MHVGTDHVERLLRLLANDAKEHAVMLLDTEGRILWWNRGAERIFGYSAGEVEGRSFELLFTPEEIERGTPEQELATARTAVAAEDDRWLARSDGSRFWATGVLVALRESGGELLGFGKILRNRTDLKEQLDTLRNQVQALRVTNRRKDIFLSTLSHELRNPLAPLANAVQMLRMMERPEPDVRDSLRIIERQVESLRRLVDDLMDVSRIGEGKIELKLQTVSLHDVVARAVESTRPLVEERRHELSVLMPAKPLLVQGDADRLEQVFVNLLNNAAKYTPEGGSIWIKGGTEGDEAVLHVEDSGVGIPHDLLPRIFDLFTQVESSRPHAQGGLGIGLSLVKSLVTIHGGSVQVRSDGPGKGSAFSVRLPMARTLS